MQCVAPSPPRRPRNLVWGFGCQGPFFLALRERPGSFVCSRRPSLRPSAVNPPFFCSTAPQAFFRPNHGLPPPSRGDDVKAGRAAATEGSAFTSASTAACWLRRVDCSCCSSLLIAPSTKQARGWLGSRYRGEPASRRERSRRQPCIRWFCLDPDHDAHMRIGCEAPRRRAQSAQRHESHGFGGSPPPRTVIGSPLIERIAPKLRRRRPLRPAA
jgi:hypothetical protein